MRVNKRAATSTIAALVNPSDPARAETTAKLLQAAARTLGLQLHILHANTDAELDGVFACRMFGACLMQRTVAELSRESVEDRARQRVELVSLDRHDAHLLSRRHLVGTSRCTYITRVRASAQSHSFCA